MGQVIYLQKNQTNTKNKPYALFLHLIIIEGLGGTFSVFLGF